MSIRKLLSDQLYIWSDQDERGTRFRPQTAAQTVAAQTASLGVGPARLTHRALQALWQTRVQVRRGSRTRPQVLPLRELPGPSAANGLRAAGRLRRDQRARRQLSSNSRDPRGDLRDQPRTAAPSRGALSGSGGPGSQLAHHPHRFALWRRAPRQHARGLARRRARVAAADRGGRR